LDYPGERKVLEALRTAGFKPAVSRFARGTETAEASAREIGVHVSRIIKSMVVSGDGKPVLVLLPGDRRADLKAVAKFVGARKVRLAFPEQVADWTGFPVGAVPPVGHVKPLRVLLDDNIHRRYGVRDLERRLINQCLVSSSSVWYLGVYAGFSRNIHIKWNLPVLI